MKTFSPPLLTLIILLFSMNNSYASDIQPSYKLINVSEGVYYHQGVHEDANESNFGAIANISFVIGSKCVAVIDSGGSYLEGTLLRNAIKQKTALPICYIINTHVHPDHTLGNAAFKDEDPEYIGHENLPAALAARQVYFARTFNELLGPAYEGTEFISPTRTVKKGEPITLALGGRELTLTAYKTSHTDHDLTVFDNKSKTLWTGDLLFIERTPVIDGSINGWIKTTQQLQSMDIHTIIPGHGPASDNWQQGVENQLRYLSVIRDEVRAIIADLGTIEEASSKVGLHEEEQWELFDHYHRRNITASFVELEWE